MEKFKRIVKQLVLSFIVVLFIYSCQKDDAVPLASQTQQSEHSTTKTVSASEIPKVMQFLQSKSNSRLEFLVDDSNTELGMYRSHEENLSMTNALTEHIKMMTNAYGKSNYTFELIEQGDKTGIYFINLVVKEYRDTLYMYIIKYVPDASWLETHHMIKDFNVFTGKLYIYNDLGVYVGKVEMLDGQATLGFQKHPCNGESGTSTSTGNATGTSSGVGTSNSSTVGVSSTSSSGTTTGGGSEGIPCRWEIYESDDCDCVPNLVIICPEEAFDVDRSALSNALRHPCDGNGAGSSGNLNNPDCEEEDLCNFPMYLDENCDCVEAEAIENSGVAIVNSDKEHCKKLNDLLADSYFMSALSDIQNGANGDSERGYEISRSPNASHVSTNFVQGGFDNIPLANGGDIIGGMHNHTQEHGNPMFSGQDISTLFFYYLRNQNRPTGEVTPNDVFSVVVTEHGTFAITINDFLAFSSLLDQGGARKLTEKLEEVYSKITGWQGQSKYTGGLLKTIKKMLEEEGISTNPINLYELNQDGTAFEKITLNSSGEPESSPCISN